MIAVMVKHVAVMLAPLFLSTAAICFGAERSSTNPTAVELKGKVAPNTATLLRTMKFTTDGGVAYTLISNRMSSALFIDTNLQSKTLLLKGRVWPGIQSFEVTGNLRSVRDGKIYELYYFCDICTIKGIDPGPCMCCRDPVRLVEKPANEEE